MLPRSRRSESEYGDATRSTGCRRRQVRRTGSPRRTHGAGGADTARPPPDAAAHGEILPPKKKRRGFVLPLIAAGGHRRRRLRGLSLVRRRPVPRLDRRRLREGRHVDHRRQGRGLRGGRAGRRQRAVSKGQVLATDRRRRLSQRGRCRPGPDRDAGRHGRADRPAGRGPGRRRSTRPRPCCSRPRPTRRATGRSSSAPTSLMQSTYGTQQKLDQAAPTGTAAPRPSPTPRRP